MSKKQNQTVRKDISFLIFIGTIIIFIFLFTAPKVSSSIFPFKRTAILNEFVTNTKSTNSIDPQDYWKFREFYSPGYFLINKNGIDTKTLNSTLSNINSEIQISDSNFSPVLVFNSKRTTSIDALTTVSNLNQIISSNNFTGEYIINNPNEKVIENESSIYILFLKPQSEMERANGFFDYKDQDKELVRSKHWFNITKVTK